MGVAGSYQEEGSLKEAWGPLPSSGQRVDRSPRRACRWVPLAHMGIPKGQQHQTASLLPRKWFRVWEVDQVSGKEKGEIPKREPSLSRLHVVS